MFCLNTKFKKEAGFTLIEMLVVVAIIGILSSVLLTALGPAKNKAKDARIVQEVNQALAIAETLNNGTYDSLPTREDEIARQSSLGPLAADIDVQGGHLVIRKNSAAYIMYSKLNTVSEEQPGVQKTNYYCGDSAGKAEFTTDEVGLFDANKFNCP